LTSYLLILFALYYSYKQKLGLEKIIFINSLRAFGQLLLVGYLLVYIFKLKNLLHLIIVLIIMCMFAAYTAQKRINLPYMGYITAFFSILISSFIVLTSILIFHVIKSKAHEIIPVGGMVIGGSLNIYTIVIDRLKGEIKNTIDIIENMTALGASIKEALRPCINNSIKAAFIPILNSLQTVGIIHIPGITTGMLIAGVKPLKAVSYQLAIMYMLVSVALFTGYFTVFFSYKIIPFIISENTKEEILQ